MKSRLRSFLLRCCLLLTACCILPAVDIYAQSESKTITLNDALQIARNHSRDALSAKNRFLSSFWEYRTFKTQYLPMLKLNTTLPSLSRSIIKYTNSLGQDVFLEQKVMNYSGNLSLSKTVGATGGQLFVKTGLQRIDNLSDSTITSYMANPVTIGFSQPLLAYNQYRWDNKIEPLKYEEAKKKYLEDEEQVSLTTISAFFDVLQSQLSLKIAVTNQANYDTLFKIAQGRYNLGKIAANDLLQLQLSFLKAKAGVESDGLEVENSIFRLKSLLRLPENEGIQLLPPDGDLDVKVNVQKAIAEAKTNRSDVFAFEKEMLQAESEVHQARLQNRFNANLYAEYGLTQSATDFKKVYQNPQDEQVVTFGISVPIVDWGLARGKIKMAESNRDLVKNTVEQQQIDFEQQVFLKVMQFNMQKNQLEIAAKSDTVARKRYYVTKQRYLIGKIDITDLNIAQSETDNAQLGFISALRSYWQNYYELRKLTLYDFKNAKELDVDYKQLIK
jgi:outer membrane protein